MKRRDFLKAGAATGAAFSLGVSLTGCRSDAPPASGDAPFAPDAWIRLFPDGSVLVEVDRSEMGQGVSTALPMLVAEEMDADWSRVRFEFAPANQAYYNPLVRAQVTGGSTSVMAAWVPLREAGAKARGMLIAAAAAGWGVPADECTTEPGLVVHERTGQRADYGSLAARAAGMPVPAVVALKEPKNYRLIGKAVPRLDTRLQVTGRMTFGVDAGPPGALVALIERPPVFGGRLVRFDDAKARSVAGVKQVVAIEDGVAVVADGFWSAFRGRAALQVEWDNGPNGALDSEVIERQLTSLVQGEGREARKVGRGGRAFDRAVKVIEAEYDLPFLAHACMEPMNCTADVRPDGVTLWVPTQAQAAPKLFGIGSRGVAARIAGVSEDRVTVISTNLGGGFGRRSESDFVAEAVQVSKAVGAPVKVIWTREDDIQHDFFRPVSKHRVRAAVDSTGVPLAWHHHVAAPPIMARLIPSFVPDVLARLAGPMKGGVDASSVEGAVDLPYRIPNLEVRYSQADLPVPVGFWRSVGHSHTAFAVECFIDELAHEAGQDPVQFRMDLLPLEDRLRRVLREVAERSSWGSPLPAGSGRGVAVHASFGSFAAQVAEVEVQDGIVRVRRVVCAFDCGIVVNPEIVTQQVEGGIVYGLAAALKGRISIRDGHVVESNFHDYQVLTMAEMPVIDVVLIPSGDAPGGVGEPATPPIAPAVANAVFAATGRRVRRLPLGSLSPQV
ncbi:MAG: molybdopterin-dependent oxidoreductase [Gemmatimonadota bacterium]|jgi:isoquinoline 1-oxidoreductase beta subunit|nr:molybdopterin-dependent oxidoreductase [Gemmatimonadota bacterium]